ncbi:MAG: peptidoglycan-binding protein [Eggerthellaceae bacterium]|jgi:peptidoglycan hydrolase-like protein with peptidoglycan-binding domain|nr:peptidoglycan-binding protein [Eggerthellaceae bacterium]
MELIRKKDTGAAVKDVQRKLCVLHLLDDAEITGTFDDRTVEALHTFCNTHNLPDTGEVTTKVWAALLDATFQMGDRTLFLRMPYFHGNDVLELQQALCALGFSCGTDDGIFGAYTELALRKFQMNMGLPTDGIAGAFTFRSIEHLHHSWEGKSGPRRAAHMGFARAADVLENHALCLFGTDTFTRSVAARMSNLSLATNPASKILSAESLLVLPDEDMLLVHIVTDGTVSSPNIPYVTFEDEDTLALRLRSAISAITMTPPRIAVMLPGEQWQNAGSGRSAQHFAIALLDALCEALSDEPSSEM